MDNINRLARLITRLDQRRDRYATDMQEKERWLQSMMMEADLEDRDRRETESSTGGN